MISRPAVRLLGALFAIGFAFVTELPAFGSPCPFHDPAFARLATANAHAHGANHSSSVAGHHSMPAQDYRINSKDGHREKSHGCTCIGCGNCASPFALAPTSLSVAPATITVGTTVPLPPIEKHARSSAKHALPFSTAPPPPPPPPSLIG